MFAGWLSLLTRSHFGWGAELPEGMTLGVCQVVMLPADAARPSQKGCLATTIVGKWKRMTSEEVLRQRHHCEGDSRRPTQPDSRGLSFPSTGHDLGCARASYKSY